MESRVDMNRIAFRGPKSGNSLKTWQRGYRYHKAVIRARPGRFLGQQDSLGIAFEFDRIEVVNGQSRAENTYQIAFDATHNVIDPFACFPS